MEAAVLNNITPGRIVLALSWGDQWTNLFQPFWALPLLGITGARAGDILGYTMLLGVAVGLIFGLASVIA
jgi:short-chain fatty acids transporter